MNQEIKTKEQILDEVYNKSYDSLDGYSQSTALKAMDEYAKQISIEFLKYWNYECVGYPIEEEDDKKFTELYELFSKQTEGK